MNKSEHVTGAPWFPLTAFVFFAACIFATGFVYYTSLHSDIRRKNIETLSAIADLKILQLSQWRQEKIQDVELLAGDPHLNENIHGALHAQDDGKQRAEILTLLQLTRHVHGYNNIAIYDTKGARLFADAEQDILPPDQAAVARALNQRRTVMGDSMRDAASGAIYLSIVAPLSGAPDPGAAPAGVLVVCLDLQDYFFSLIQSWPTTSRTVETLLVRREGNEVVYLSELRHQKNTALVLRRSASERDLPAARAVRGETDSAEGLDYRGVDVIYAARKVPDTDWMMIAKIDADEIFGLLRWQALIASLVLGLLVAAVGMFMYGHLFLRRTIELRREQDLETATRDLNVRIRELNCLFGISSIVENHGDSLPDILQGIVELLPSAWQHPEITCACITLDGRQYAMKNCRQTARAQSADIAVQGKAIGSVVVYSQEEVDEADTALFASQQHNLLLEVADRIARIIEQLRAREALRERDEQFHNMLQSAMDGFWVVDPRGRLLEVNGAYCRMSGYRKDELLQLAIPDLEAAMSPATIALRIEEIRRDGAARFESRHRCKDGRLMDVEVSTSYVAHLGGRFYAFVRDITERKRAEEEIRVLTAELEKMVAARTAQLQQTLDTLRTSEERYRIVADFTCDWEFWVSPEKKYLYVSPSFEAMTGYPAQLLYDDFKFLETIIHPDDRALIIPHMESDEHTHAAPIDFRILTRDGQERWISHVCQKVFADDGRCLGMRGSNRDITETKKLRDEAIRDAHLASIGRLAAGMAHEINNPISGVINYAQIIRNKCILEDKYREFVDEIIVESERVATIVKDLLMFSRPYFGEAVPTDLRDIYSQTFSLISKQLNNSAVTIAVSFPDDLPPVLVRPQQIKQVILNFFTNAIYALNKKFPDADPEKILEVDAERAGAFVRLVFHDHGIGIPAGMIDRVCEPFLSTKPPGEGTGLGLSISHTILKEHGGRFRIESKEGEYTKVIMDLPAAEDGQ